MKPDFRAVMIAGTNSGAGKTTWALALMALARKKGLQVQPFKAGPDYIDPSFHHQVCHPRKSRNLDLFLLPENSMKESFARNTQDVDLAIVEGMMGLFDGKGSSGTEGSSAQMAKLLGLPVFLVLDGAGLATSAAAIVLGFQKFDPELNLAGVLLNRVNSERHFLWIKKAIEEKTGVPCLGYLPKDESLHIPERHLGLTTAVETGDISPRIEKAVSALEKSFDWEKFCDVTCHPGMPLSRDLRGPSLTLKGCFAESCRDDIPGARIAIAYDAAFSFYYEDNFDLLKEAGAELVFFSPLKDKNLPENIDVIYFGGGFPEIYAARLSENQSMIQSIKDFYHSGGFIYAECGGFIYLNYAGLIPGKIQMADRLQHFGYHEIEAAGGTFLFPAGQKLRSHEFHYSQWIYEGPFQPVYRIGERMEGFATERLVASYQHLHFGGCPELAGRMTQCRKKSLPVSSH